ncbi:MAG: hypothetical protein QNJ85_04650 [Gammaproteobacteria bacterium]|nr:hypothetical protein [Gammaproteobacteria bacterium]
MSEKLEQMRASLHARLDDVVDALSAAQNNLEAAPKEAETEIRARLDAARSKIGTRQQEVEAARSRITDYVATKKAEIEAQVAQWKANREQDRLVMRAELAEEYAESCLLVALASAADADEAVLQAIAARKDADAASD